MTFENTLDFARLQDVQDPLKHFRSKFFIPQHNNKDAVYFTGNSLGLQPKSVIDYINLELEDWASLYRPVRRCAVRGVTSEGLAMTQLPAARAGAIFQVNKYKGRFQGEIHPTMPMG